MLLLPEQTESAAGVLYRESKVLTRGKFRADDVSDRPCCFSLKATSTVPKCREATTAQLRSRETVQSAAVLCQESRPLSLLGIFASITASPCQVSILMCRHNVRNDNSATDPPPFHR
jgi:hypothetical protein